MATASPASKLPNFARLALQYRSVDAPESWDGKRADLEALEAELLAARREVTAANERNAILAESLDVLETELDRAKGMILESNDEQRRLEQLLEEWQKKAEGALEDLSNARDEAARDLAMEADRANVAEERAAESKNALAAAHAKIEDLENAAAIEAHRLTAAWNAIRELRQHKDAPPAAGSDTPAPPIAETPPRRRKSPTPEIKADPAGVRAVRQVWNAKTGQWQPA